jgi:GntR family transcriptional regulator/MocR family aminotransferase
MKKKYYDIYVKTKEKILSGEYRPGEKLPSKRVMADMMGCSIITVQTAYSMLSDEGYIEAKERSGYYVLALENSAAKPLYKGGLGVKHVQDLNGDRSVDFESSVWFKTVRKVMADSGEKLFVRAPSEGCAVLRNAIADYLHRYRGMTVDAHRIIIGSGAEQLYETAVKLIGRNKVYGIEDPCYSKIEQVYDGMGVDVCHLRLGADGIEADALMSGGFDVLHVTPFHSYPSGVTTSASKRYKYLNWAVLNGGYVIEDDFDSEFFIPGQPVETLYSLDNAGAVVYINTFSKSISPAIRVGYMILPESLLAIYEQKLSNFSCTVPVMEQYVLAEFNNSGDFERHLNRRRKKIKTEKFCQKSSKK